MTANPKDSALQDLITIRDWLRYGVSRFNAAGLVYGHGTSDALNEAAFLILRGLDLPPDQLEPWLDARLTLAERKKIAALIETRIETRKPAPYLLNEAWIRGHKFYTDERIIVPRSYIGELLDTGLDLAVPDPFATPYAPTRILDLCTGGGPIAILASLAFPEASVDAVDISPDALAVAQRNIEDYALTDRIKLIPSDLFTGLGTERYDLILSNPPYVSDAAIADFPPEYRAEPKIAHAGGEDGLNLIRKIIAEAPRHLTRKGALIVEVGRGKPVLEAEFPGLPFLWLDTEESEGEVFALSHPDLDADASSSKSSNKGTAR